MIQCTLTDDNLSTPPKTGECTESPTDAESECEIKCAEGYAVGAIASSNNEHHLKCTCFERHKAAWRQRDNPDSLPPSCQSEFWNNKLLNCSCTSLFYWNLWQHQSLKLI